MNMRIVEMKNFMVIAFFLIPALGFGQTPTGEEILQRVDDNIISGNRAIISTMIVHGKRTTRTIQSKSWIQGTNESFSEYLAPAREKGTKMLKLKDQLWMYSPQSDRIIRIAGHMLRQSMMGSDLSYEDMMEDRSLLETYTAEVLGSEIVDERDCWVLQLSSKVDDVAYDSQKIWIDMERMLGLKQDLIGKSGKLLKTITVEEVFLVEGRWYPKHMVFKDALSKGSGTEFIIDKIEFDVEIPDFLFTKAALRK